MTRYVAYKVLHMVLVLFLVSLATYSIFDLLPGDPAYAILGPEASPEAAEALTKALNLDAPFPERYGEWLGNALTGDLGRSIVSQRPVATEMMQKFPVTLEIALVATVMALVMSIPVAMIQAAKENSAVDRGFRAIAAALIATPTFLIAMLLVFIFPLTLGFFPVTGFSRLGDGVLDNIRYVFLPSLTLAIVEFAALSQILRGDLTTTLREDFITSAKAKGASRSRIMVRHALRPSSFSMLTVATLNLGRLIGGTVIVETVFGIGGIGTMLVNAINAGDIPRLQGPVLAICAAFVVLNALVDVTYSVLDPRVRQAHG